MSGFEDDNLLKELGILRWRSIQSFEKYYLLQRPRYLGLNLQIKSPLLSDSFRLRIEKQQTVQYIGSIIFILNFNSLKSFEM